MMAFLLLGFFAILAFAFLAAAWSATDGKRCSMKGTPNVPPTGTSGENAAIHHHR